jgi:hypothetical protein
VSNLHLILYNDDRQIDAWDIDPNWDALDVAEFLNSLGTKIYELIRDSNDGVPVENDEGESQ